MNRILSRLSLGAFAALGLLLLTGAVLERTARGLTRDRFPAPGRTVAVHDATLQLDCRGSGLPTVVLESGLDHLGSLSWAAVHDSLAAGTRVCAYSREGILWSSPAHRAFHPARATAALHEALRSAGERAPFVMAGHSLGVAYVMAFTQRYPDDVAGLVFVDGSHPDQFERFEEATGRPLKPTPEVLHVGSALAWTGLLRALPSQTVGGMPAHAAAIADAFLPLSVAGLLAEVRAIDTTLAVAGRSRDLGDRPLVVLTGAEPLSAERLQAEGLTAKQGAALQAAIRQLNAEQSGWSSRGRHELVAGAGHYIQFDRPEVVVRAIREVVSAQHRAIAGVDYSLPHPIVR